jgi:hypothetical protein
MMALYSSLVTGFDRIASSCSIHGFCKNKSDLFYQLKIILFPEKTERETQGNAEYSYEKIHF